MFFKTKRIEKDRKNTKRPNDGRCINTLWVLRHKWENTYGNNIFYLCERCNKIRT